MTISQGDTGLTERTFDETLATTEGLLLVDFWAPWCGPCRAVAPVLEALTRESAGRVALAKVNVDEQPGLAARFEVRSIPTILFVRDGRILDRVVGALPKAALQAKVDRALTA
jgi:thioredoxin